MLQGPNEAPSVQGSFGFRVQGPGQNQGPRQQPSAGANEQQGPTSASVPTSQAPPAAAQPPTIRNPRVSVFADVIEDMERIQFDLRPHLTTIRQLLRDDPTFENNSAEHRLAQHTYNQVAYSFLKSTE